MKKVTLISYPTDQSHLLSLTDHSSRYEMYYGGRFRILDFILSLALNIDTEKIVLLEPHFSGSLENFCSDPEIIKDFPPIKVEKVNEQADYQQFLDIITKYNESDYLLFMNGDSPLFGLIADPVREMITADYNFGIIEITTGKKKNHTSLILAKRELILKIIKDKFNKIDSYKNFFSEVKSIIAKEKNVRNVEVDGFYSPVNNLYDYLNTNFKFLKNIKFMISLYKRIPLGNIIEPMRGDAIVKRYAHVKNSLISDNCEIFGEVENSVIFPNVTILKKSKIKNSIILPNTVIGEDCNINCTIIDETFESLKLKKTVPTIGDESVIGKESFEQKNSFYPEALLRGITLIGPNCILPKNLNVGAACYIKGGTDKLILSKNSIIKDTETV